MKCMMVLAVAAAAAMAAQGADFALVEKGAAVAAFEFGTMPDDKAKASAEKDVALFNKHLKEVTGCELATVANGTKATERAKGTIEIDLKPIGDIGTRFDWQIDFPSAGVMRVEATTTSLFTALRQLIEEGCDARFLGTERCMFQFEPRRDVAVEVRTRRNAPHSFTLLRHNGFSSKSHQRELGLSDDGLFKYRHGIPVYAFPSEKYNREGWPAAIMPVLKGKRITSPPGNPYYSWEPCFSNPETARIASENILGFMRKNPGMKSVTLGVNDLGGYCQCDACLAMDANAEPPSAFSNDYDGNRSASYYTFVNRVAEAVCAEFPGTRIGLLAYTGTVMPPPFKVHPNVVPVITLDTHSAGMDPEVRARHENVFRRWGEKVRETGTWDYSWGGGYYIPRVDFANRAARLKFLHAHGGRAYYGEIAGPDALDGPKTYLTARLLEDIDADADAILDEWYRRFAGAAAAKPLREIYRRSTEYWVSPRGRKSPKWTSRTYIYSFPNHTQFYAVWPGFTEGLLKLAQEVRALASTPGEKARAEVLLRHFERLDCMASFKGCAYMDPSSGELTSAADAAKMLDNFADRADALFAAWERVRRYFLEAPDFDDPNAYGKRRNDYDTVMLLAEQFGKARRFKDDPAVVAALRRIAALENLPAYVRKMLRNIFSRKAENHFSNPGFAKPLDETRIKTTLPYELVDDAESGGKAVKVWPGRPNGDPDPDDIALRGTAAFSFVENLKPGIYMAAVRVRPEAASASGDLALWRQTDGKDGNWEPMHPTALRKGKWHTFVQIRTVDDTVDGLKVKLRMNGFGKDDALYIGDVKIVRLGDDVPSGREKSVSARGISPRGSVVAKVRGVDAVVSGTNAYTFAHVMVGVPRILPGEKLVFSTKVTQPEGSKTGRFGAVLYYSEKGDWKTLSQLAWDRRVSDREWEDLSFSVTAEKLGKKNGQYMLIFFKMRGTDPVAVSNVSWHIE